MTKQKIELELDVPEGYEVTGEYRKAQRGEWVINGSGGVMKITKPFRTACKYIILRKIEPECYFECQGPKNWPAFKWAAKDKYGYWHLFLKKPKWKYGTWHESDDDISFGVSYISGWNIPQHFVDLPPKESLIKLRNTCKHVHTHDNGPYKTECGHTVSFSRKYCQVCGRKVETV